VRNIQFSTRMEDSVISKLTHEMTCYGIVHDILSLHVIKADNDILLLALLDEDTTDSSTDFEMLLLLRKLCDIDSECDLMAKILDIFHALISAPDSLLRPYQQHFVTESGANRVTIENFHEKFRGLSRAYFRFDLAQVLQLIEVLQIPSRLVFNGYNTTALEAVCVSLHRLATHCRFIDLSLIYDCRPQFLSQVFAGTMVFIFRRHGDTVRTFEHSWTTDRERLDDYAQKVENKGCPLRNCVAFVDGSHVPVARPTRGQRSWFCGHHRTHCFKTTVIQYPNGLLTSFGPYDGSTHDSTAAQTIDLDGLVSTNYTFPDVAFCLFGDSGYGITPSIVTPFRRRPGQTPAEAEWNRRMSSYRITVEWGIGRVKTMWKAVTNKGNLKALLSPVSIYWFNAVLLTNIHCCMNGSEISQYYDCQPPSVEEYLRL